jgi:integrase
MSTSRRRTAGEGSISPYVEKSGVTTWTIRYWAPLPDGTINRFRRRGFATKRDAAAALVDVRSEVKRGTHVVGKRGTVAEYFTEWVGGLRLRPSTLASYRKNIRVHVVPHIGQVRLDELTGLRLSALYQHLEKHGRSDLVDPGGPLKARTVRAVHDIINAGLKAAVRDGLLVANPADRSNPPTAAQAKAPEISPWTDGQVRAFLAWSSDSRDDLRPAWLLLLATGLRRGEVLGLRWNDINQANNTISVRRAVTSIREAGEPERIEIGPVKAGPPRGIDVGEETMRALASYRATRASISLALASPNEYVFGSIDGGPHHPDRFSRKFRIRSAACRASQVAKAERLAESTGTEPDLSELLPDRRFHDLRHACATLAFQSGVHPKVVQERLGHANLAVTMGIYSHVTPTMQRGVADLLDTYLH